MLEIKTRKGTEMEPWWKWRIESVKQLHRELGHINNTLIERKHIKEKDKDALEGKYQMKQRGLPVTRQEINEII